MKERVISHAGYPLLFLKVLILPILQVLGEARGISLRRWKKPIVTGKHELLILYKIRALFRGSMDKNKSNSLGLHAQRATDLEVVKCGKNIPSRKNSGSKCNKNRIMLAEDHSTHASSSRLKQPQASFSFSPTGELFSLGQLTLFSGL